MMPSSLQPLFWDIDVRAFDAALYPNYTIRRVLELGDPAAVVWMQSIFTAERIVETIRLDARLSRRSATFWGLVYGVPRESIAALVEPPMSWREALAHA